MTAPYLSIIIPAYNEAHRLPKTLEQVQAFVQSQPFSTEVLVVENASQDNTLEIAQGYAQRYPHFQALHETQRGKGRAVQRGMLAARGEFRFMADADLSMPPGEITRFLPPLLENCDVAIGSREAPGAIRYDEPHYRHFGGRAINLIIRTLALPGLHDTQCGFKCFRAGVAEDLFAVQTLPGWSFDIELLFVARQRGYRIVELPIPWYYQTESKVNAVRDALRMVRDIFTIRRNARQGVYARPAAGNPARRA